MDNENGNGASDREPMVMKGLPLPLPDPLGTIEYRGQVMTIEHALARSTIDANIAQAQLCNELTLLHHEKRRAVEEILAMGKRHVEEAGEELKKAAKKTGKKAKAR